MLGAGPALPCALVVEAGSWDSAGLWWSLQGSWISHQSSTIHTPFRTAQTGLSCQGCTDPLPLLEPKLLKPVQLSGATVFPVTPEGEGKKPTEAGMCLCLDLLPQGTWVLPWKRVFLQPHEGPAASPPPPPAAQNPPPPRLHSFLGSSPLHPSHFIQEALP